MAFDKNITYPTTLPSNEELSSKLRHVDKVVREVEELDVEYDRMVKLQEAALKQLKEKGDERNKMIYDFQMNIVNVVYLAADHSRKNYYMLAIKKEVDDLHKQARKLGFHLSFYPAAIWDDITSGVNVIGMISTREEILDKLKQSECSSGSSNPAKKYKQTK